MTSNQPASGSTGRWDTTRFSPPETPVLGSNRDAPKIRDLVGFVLASIGPQEAEMFSERYGNLDVVRLQHLVVFNQQGHPTGYHNYVIWQTVLQQQMGDQPVVVGRLLRPEQAFVLAEIEPDKVEQVMDALLSHGWITEDGEPAPTTPALTGHRRTASGEEPF